MKKSKKLLFLAVSVIVSASVVGTASYVIEHKKLDVKQSNQISQKDNSSSSKKDSSKDTSQSDNGTAGQNLVNNSDSSNQQSSEANSTPQNTSTNSTKSKTATNTKISSTSSGNQNSTSGSSSTVGSNESLDSIINNSGTYSGDVLLSDANKTYGPNSVQALSTINGNVLIKADEITIQNTTINGTITVDPGENGTVNLNNVVATNIEVKSGGKNSIHFNSVNVTENLTVNSTSFVRVEASGSTSVPKTTLNSGAILEVAGGSLGNVEVSNSVKGQTVELRGKFDKPVAVNGDITVNVAQSADAGTTSIPSLQINGQVTINAASSTTVSNLEISPSNNGTVTLAGNFATSTITVTKPAALNVSSNTSVSNLVVNAAAQINADNSSNVSKVSIAPQNSTDNIKLSGKLNTVEVVKAAVVIANSDANISNINVAPENNAAVTLSGNFTATAVKVSKPATVTVSKDTTVSSIQVDAKADVNVGANTKVSEVKVNSESNVNVDKDAKVENVAQNTNNSTITGSGADKISVVKNLLDVKEFKIEQNPNFMIGTSLKLNITAFNEKGIVDGVKYDFKSTDDNILAIDENGNLSAKTVGTVKVTISTSNTLDKISVSGEVHVVKDFSDLAIGISNAENWGYSSDHFSVLNGASLQLYPYAKDKNLSDGIDGVEASYKSSDDSIVAVDQNGMLTAKSIGEATITMTTINTPEPKIVTEKVNVVDDVSSLKQDNDNSKAINFLKGTNYNLMQFTHIVALDSDNNEIYGINLSYSSSNSDVLEVDNKGNITTKAAGNAVLTVTETSTSSKKSADITFNVVDSVGALHNKNEEETGNSTLNVVNNNENYVNLEMFASLNEGKLQEDPNKEGYNPFVMGVSFNYTTDDPSVVTVDEKGNLIPHSTGKANITVTTTNVTPEVSKTIEVIVTDPLQVKAIEGLKDIDANFYDYNVVINPVFKDDNGNEVPNVQYKIDTDNNQVAKSIGGPNICLTGTGTAHLTLTTINTEKPISQSFTVNVIKNLDIDNIMVEDNLYIINGGKSNLNPFGQKDNHPVDGAEFSFKSSNTDVATVDEKGNIAAVGKGEATITVESTNTVKKVSKEISIQVVNSIDDFYVNSDIYILKGSSTEIYNKAIVNKMPAEGVNYKYSFDDDTIAALDTSNNLKGLKEGVTKVTITSVNTVPSVTKTATVHVVTDVAESHIAVYLPNGIGFVDNLKLGLSQKPLPMHLQPYSVANGVESKDLGRFVQGVSYSVISDDPKVVDVDQYYNLITKGLGTANITFTPINTKTQASVTLKVQVTEQVKVASIDGLQNINASVTMENPSPTVTVHPIFRDATGKEISNIGYILVTYDTNFIKSVKGDQVTINGPFSNSPLSIVTTNTPDEASFMFNINVAGNNQYKPDDKENTDNNTTGPGINTTGSGIEPYKPGENTTNSGINTSYSGINASGNGDNTTGSGIKPYKPKNDDKGSFTTGSGINTTGTGVNTTPSGQ